MKKEIIIKSKWEGGEIVAQLLGGEIVMITDDNDGKDEEGWSSDNAEYIYTVYKVLKEVARKGGFTKLDESDEENSETINV